MAKDAEITNTMRKALERAYKAACVMEAINKFDSYVPEADVGEMSLPQLYERMRDERDARRSTKADIQELKRTISTVGSDAHAGRVAAEHAAHDAAATRGDIADSEERMENMIHQKFQELEPTKDQVSYLAGKKTTRSINGKKAQAKANADPDIAEAKQRAADDMTRAVDRVRERVLEHEKENEKYNLLAICRTVCNEFTPLTTKKNALGKFEKYAPLMDWQGNSIQPDTLRKNYTARFGTKKAQKSQDHAKPKTSTKPKVKRTTK